MTLLRGHESEYNGESNVPRIGHFTALLDTTRFDSLAALLLSRPKLASRDSTDEGRGWVSRLPDCGSKSYAQIGVVIRGHALTVTDRCADSLFDADYIVPAERVSESLPWRSNGWLTTGPRTLESQLHLPPSSVEYHASTMRYQGDTSTDPRPDFTALFREPAVEVLGYHRGTMDFEKVVKHVTATIPRGRTYRLLTIDLCEGGEHCLTHPFNFDSLQGTSRQ